MDTSELKNMHVMLTIPTKTEFIGRYSSVSTHPSQDLVVCVFDTTVTDQRLCCSVGTLQKANGEIAWGPVCQYDSGTCPSVALISLGSDFYAIETHATGFLTASKCCYRVGKVNVDQKTIEWGSTKEVCRGKKPKVCANDDGTVIIVNEESHAFWGEKIYHNFFKVNPEEKTLERPHGRDCEILDFEGVEPNIAISEDRVVIVYRAGVSALKIAVGELRREQTRIEWNTAITSVLPFTGKEPTVSINSRGNIIVSHQTALTMYRLIAHNYGHISSDAIVWKTNEAHTVGEYPCISLADDGCIVEMHKSNFGTNLYQSQGDLQNQV